MVRFRVNFGERQDSVLSPFLFNIYLHDLAKLNNYKNRSFVIVYADEILLIAQSVSELQQLLSACENELQLLDMVINIKKSCCLRIGSRCNVSCAKVSSQDGRLFHGFLNSYIWASLSLNFTFLNSRWFVLNVHSIMLLIVSLENF